MQTLAQLLAKLWSLTVNKFNMGVPAAIYTWNSYSVQCVVGEYQLDRCVSDRPESNEEQR